MRATSASPTTPDGSGLQPRIASRRKLSPGGRDEILLKLEPGRFARVSFDSANLELDVKLLGPGGAVLGQGAGIEGGLSFVTETGGTYRFLVAALDRKAGGIYRITLEEQRQVRPDDGDRVAADGYLASAGRLRAEGKKEEALAQAEEALCRWRRLQDSEREFEALYAKGLLQTELSEQEEASRSYDEALHLALLSGSRLNEARVWTALGTAMARNNPEEARGYLGTALPVWRDLGYSDRESWTLYHLGFVLYTLGTVDDAIASYQRALALAEADEDAQFASDIWNGLGNAFIARGESQKALGCFERALQLARESASQGAEAAILTGLGLLYRRRGEPQNALINFAEALKINQSDLDLRQYVGVVLIHIGSVYLDLGQTAEALDKYRQAMAVSGEGDSWTRATALLSIGEVYLATDHNQEALEQFEEALQASRKSQDTSREAAALHGIGVARLKLHQTAEALKALEEALPLRQKTARVGEALTRQAMGKAYQAQGDLPRAASLLREALEIARDVGASFVASSIGYDLARLERQRGNLQEALTQIEMAIDILESVRSDLSDDRLRTSFFSSRRPYYDFWVDLLMELARERPEMSYADKAFAASEKGRARSLFDLLVEGRLDLKRGISPELKRREQDVTARLSQIQRQLIEERSDRRKGRTVVVDALQARLREVDAERQRLELQVWAQYPRYAKIRYPSLLRREEVQQLLEPDSVLLEYSLSAESGYLFVVTREGLKVHPLSLSRNELALLVNKVRSGLEKPGPLPFSYYRAAYELYEALIAPAKDEIRGKRRLVIAPDGALYFLAFEALRSERSTSGAPYLIQTYSINYVPSASVLSSLSQPRSPMPVESAVPKRFLAFAPEYLPTVSDQDPGDRIQRGDFHALQLPPLAGARQEVEEIAKRYPSDEVRVYLQQEATEENVKDNRLVHSAKWIHFAAHGIFDPEKPEYSGLVLAQTPSSSEDGFLQVFEIFNLEMNADLVVLSACQTGLGTEVTGEGLVGLTRAFLYAGTTSIVVSLWVVADSSASELMPRFYQNLDQGSDKAEALRLAKLAMIHEGGKFSRPYYWAPFILVGKTR